jgi:hypothetical protein
VTDIIAFQAGREARIADKPRDARRNADWLHGWDTVDMQERLTRSMTPSTPPLREGNDKDYGNG